MELNVCYIVGTALLYIDKLSFEDLEKIGNKLSNKVYIVDVSEESIYLCLNEWTDFFVMDLENNILLTESAKQNKHMVELIFNSVLEPNVNKDILNSILYRNKQQCKIIKFQ